MKYWFKFFLGTSVRIAFTALGVVLLLSVISQNGSGTQTPLHMAGDRMGKDLSNGGIAPWIGLVLVILFLYFFGKKKKRDFQEWKKGKKKKKSKR